VPMRERRDGVVHSLRTLRSGQMVGRGLTLDEPYPF
jgi:hypothetical protein